MGGLSKAAEEMFVKGPARRMRAREEEEEEEQRAGDHSRGRGPGRVRANERMHDGHYSGVEMEKNRFEDSYAQMDYEGRTHRVSGPSARSTYSDTESDMPTTSRHYEGRGVHARGDDFYDDDEEYYDGPSMPRGHGARGYRARRDEYEDEDEAVNGGSDTPMGDRGRRIERSPWL